jgi:quinol monooxygenase YgiN
MTMQLRVIAQAWARPGKEPELREALAALAAPSRADPGCLAWEAYDDPQETRRFMTVELWADQEAFAAHMATPHVKAIIARAQDLLTAPPEIRSFRRIA